MTRLVVETDNDWTRNKIKAAIHVEVELLKNAIQKTEAKLRAFEAKHGTLDRAPLYGKADDMELLEWEGESETLERLKSELNALEEITFEYK